MPHDFAGLLIEGIQRAAALGTADIEEYQVAQMLLTHRRRGESAAPVCAVRLALYRIAPKLFASERVQLAYGAQAAAALYIDLVDRIQCHGAIVLLFQRYGRIGIVAHVEQPRGLHCVQIHAGEQARIVGDIRVLAIRGHRVFYAQTIVAHRAGQTRFITIERHFRVYGYAGRGLIEHGVELYRIEYAVFRALDYGIGFRVQ